MLSPFLCFLLCDAWQGKELAPLPYTLSEVMAAATDAEDPESAVYVAKVNQMAHQESGG